MDGDGLAVDRLERAKALKRYGSIQQAVNAGALPHYVNITLTEALVLGLYNQGVTKYIGIFGHGSTDLGDVLQVYEEAGIKTYAVHHETAAAHAATTLYWQYGETAAVFTSIGPGAMHALAGSLAALSNGAGVYYLLGEETTHDEGPNMQQIPRREQGLFLRLTSALGPSYTLHTPEAINVALRRGLNATQNAVWSSPFYMLMPMNTQPQVIEGCNLLALPKPAPVSPATCGDAAVFDAAVEAIKQCDKIVIKIGGGAKNITNELTVLAERIDAVVVSGPQVPGVYAFSNPRNMTVGGSKGSISGNFAMNGAELAILIGGRAVCQWDCSGVAWKNARQFINFNTNPEDANHYNRTIPIVGDARANLHILLRRLEEAGVDKRSSDPSPWVADCITKRTEWDEYRNARYAKERLKDEVFGDALTQPAAIKAVCDFAASVGAVKYFDAGDVQANGFQVVEDEEPGSTFTDTGASYMGFAASSLLACAMADTPRYGIALSGEGSFLMNPQVLVDGVEHGVKGMIVIFDNRRMGAITGLQYAQYGKEHGTNDSVPVDYVALCNSVKGVKAVAGGSTRASLDAALKEAHEHKGLSVVHVPVYFGDDEMGGLGAWGQWNVGNWCDDVQKEHRKLGL